VAWLLDAAHCRVLLLASVGTDPPAGRLQRTSSVSASPGGCAHIAARLGPSGLAGQELGLHRPNRERQCACRSCGHGPLHLVDLDGPGGLVNHQPGDGCRNRAVAEQDLVVGASGIEVTVDDDLTGPLAASVGVGEALLRLIGRRDADAEPLAQGSDGQCEFVERDRHPLVHWLLAREIVVPTSQVLQEPGSWPYLPYPGSRRSHEHDAGGHPGGGLE